MDTLTDYPSHIYDPLRRKIAQRYIQHELRKLFPALRDPSAWQNLDAGVVAWFDRNPTLMPVRDFWNGVHGISRGFKLKDIVSRLTSRHIQWEEREVVVGDLWFGSTLGTFGALGEKPSAVQVRDWLLDAANRKIFEEARKVAELKAAETAPRDHYPIIVNFTEGKLRVSDGNRRVLAAILSGQSRILAAIGEPVGQPEIFDQWVPTSFLQDLTALHRRGFHGKSGLTEHCAGVIAQAILDSAAGQFEWVNRCLDPNNPADVALREAVESRFS